MPTGTIKKISTPTCNSRSFLYPHVKYVKGLKKMKKLLMLFGFVLSYCTMADAHAGMYDRYLDMKICVDALVMVIAVTQVFIYLFSDIANLK